MKDLFQATDSNFDKPDYWKDKEQSYYSLFAKFMKVCLLVKIPQNTFTLCLLLALRHFSTHLRNSCYFNPRRKAEKEEEDEIPQDATIVDEGTQDPCGKSFAFYSFSFSYCWMLRGPVAVYNACQASLETHACGMKQRV